MNETSTKKTIQSYESGPLPVEKNGVTLTLKPVTIGKVREGSTAWVYPSIPIQEKDDDGKELLSIDQLRDGVNKLKAWLGEKRFSETILDTMDAEFQQAWRSHQDVAKFTEAILSDVSKRGREAKLSVKLLRRLGEILKQLKSADTTPDQKIKLKEEHKKVGAEMLAAQMAEMEDIDLS